MPGAHKIGAAISGPELRAEIFPKGPKIEKIQDRPPGLKFSIEMKFSSEPPTKPLIFVGNSEGPGLKTSIEIDFFFFSLWALREWPEFPAIWVGTSQD